MKIPAIDVTNVFRWLFADESPFTFGEWLDMAVMPFNLTCLFWKRFQKDELPKAPAGHLAISMDYIFVYIQEHDSHYSFRTYESPSKPHIDSPYVANVYKFDVHKEADENSAHLTMIQASEYAYSYMNQQQIDNEVEMINYVSFVTLGLLNVKNIKLIDEPLSRQQKRFKERNNEPVYKVLSIDSFKERVVNENRGRNEPLNQTALHLVRGNFATYTEDKPLFGKHVGTFFRPAHVRGNKDYGIIEKDYKIEVNRQ